MAWRTGPQASRATVFAMRAARALRDFGATLRPTSLLPPIQGLRSPTTHAVEPKTDAIRRANPNAHLKCSYDQILGHILVRDTVRFDVANLVPDLEIASGHRSLGRLRHNDMIHKIFYAQADLVSALELHLDQLVVEAISNAQKLETLFGHVDQRFLHALLGPFVADDHQTRHSFSTGGVEQTVELGDVARHMSVDFGDLIADLGKRY